jgi:hypothetical protein
MPRFISFRLAAACALALIVAVAFAAPVLAKGPVADIRVVGAKGKVLADDSFGTGTASVKTSPKADCFGPGTGGSGKSVTVKGPTALGMLTQAAGFTKALRPLLISDHFSFGLALCGVGGFVATETGAGWYLKVNHVDPELGGDSVKVKAGDEVLWAYVRFPYPDELALVAPDRAQAGVPFKVRVFAYDEHGRKKPVAGAKVTGAATPTGGDGRTTVTLAKPARLIARHGTEIPSNREAVCVGGKCPGSTG